MGTMHFDDEAKAELHSEAVKLIARYDSPLETVKALMSAPNRVTGPAMSSPVAAPV